MKNADILVIFDMDKTLLSCDSMELWYNFLDEKKIIDQKDKEIRKRLKRQYLDGTLDVHENFKVEFAILNRIPIAQRLAWQKEFFENYLKQTVSPKAIELINKYHKENAFIILSTSTMRFLAEPVAAYIKADHLLVTDGPLINNHYTGAIYEPANYREGKKTNFANWLQNCNKKFTKTFFYSDSINDMALLLAVDIPVAVNPDDKLHQYANDHDWAIMKFY